MKGYFSRLMGHTGLSFGSSDGLAGLDLPLSPSREEYERNPVEVEEILAVNPDPDGVVHEMSDRVEESELPTEGLTKPRMDAVGEGARPSLKAEDVEIEMRGVPASVSAPIEQDVRTVTISEGRVRDDEEQKERIEEFQDERVVVVELNGESVGADRQRQGVADNRGSLKTDMEDREADNGDTEDVRRSVDNGYTVEGGASSRRRPVSARGGREERVVLTDDRNSEDVSEKRQVLLGAYRRIRQWVEETPVEKWEEADEGTATEDEKMKFEVPLGSEAVETRTIPRSVKAESPQSQSLETRDVRLSIGTISVTVEATEDGFRHRTQERRIEAPSFQESSRSRLSRHYITVR